VVNVCDREYPKPPKCNPGEYLDEEYNENKCRPYGQCRPGRYRWDEAKKKCVSY
jgi:hypothetical protein